MVPLNGPIDPSPKDWAFSDFVLQPDGTLRCPADHPLTLQERRRGSATALYAWSMVLAHVIAVPVLFEISVKKPQQRRSLRPGQCRCLAHRILRICFDRASTDSKLH